MTASNVDKIIPFPGRAGRGATAAVGPRPRRLRTLGGGHPVARLGGTVLALAAPRGRMAPSSTPAPPPGCFRSTDGGKTWQAMNDGLTSPYIQALVASPRFAKDRTLFAGTLGSGVMRSTNGGETWGPVEFWQGAQAVTALALSPEFPRRAPSWPARSRRASTAPPTAGAPGRRPTSGSTTSRSWPWPSRPAFAEDETAFCLAPTASTAPPTAPAPGAR